MQRVARFWRAGARGLETGRKGVWREGVWRGKSWCDKSRHAKFWHAKSWYSKFWREKLWRALLCLRAGVTLALCGAFIAAAPVDLAIAASAAGRIPLPRPRPLSAPARMAQPNVQEKSKDANSSAPAMRPSIDGNADAAPSAAPRTETQAAHATPPAPPAVVSACRLALTEKIAIAPSVPPINGPGGCGGEDFVSLEAVVLPDGSRIAVTPAAMLRCEMAGAVAGWIRRDVAMLVAGQGARLLGIDNFDSYSCRGRNRVFGAKLSEHGKGNALDIRAFKLANGLNLSLTSVDVARALREAMRTSACTQFTTVLGPGSDGYHEDHVHVDLAQRRGGHRLCRWDVNDPPALAVARQGASRRDGPAEGDPEKAGQSSSDDAVSDDAFAQKETSQQEVPGHDAAAKSAALPPPAPSPVLPKARLSANAVWAASLVPMPRPRPAQASPRNRSRLESPRDEAKAPGRM